MSHDFEAWLKRSAQARLLHLKVKIASLVAEARVIRSFEEKLSHRIVECSPERTSRLSTLFYIRGSLCQHRSGVVRSALRHALLAYGFLRGLEYERMERTAITAPNFDEVRKLTERFGPGVSAPLDGFVPWRERAEAYLKSGDKPIAAAV